jgi:hypothetical protein
MAYVTLLVIMTVLATAAFFSVYVLRAVASARTARLTYRSTVEGLAARTFRAAQADRELAQGSAEVAEASRSLARQVTEVQDALALERKVRKAIAMTAPPEAPAERRADRTST